MIPEVLRKSLALCPKCGGALSSIGPDVWKCDCGYNGPNEPLNEANTDDWHYWWMDPNYKFHPVEHEGHTGFAMHYLIFDKRMRASELKGKDIYYVMYDLGWVRVGLARYMEKMMLAFNYNPEKPLSSRQLKALNDWAVEHECDEMRDNVKGKWLFINEGLEYKRDTGSDRPHAGDVNWKGKMIEMEPDKFLRLAARLPAHAIKQATINDIMDKLKRGVPLDPPILYMDMERKRVSGHEGRHRAMASKKLGIEKIPVFIYTGSGYERVPKWTKDQHETVYRSYFEAEL
jgi:hypothetical protein